MTKRKLNEWRKRKGFSQKQLAKEVGLSRQTIARYEADIGEANIHTLTTILMKLGIDMEQLELNFKEGGKSEDIKK